MICNALLTILEKKIRGGKIGRKNALMFKQKKRIWSRQDIPGRPGKVPGLDRTGPRDPEGPMVPWSRDLKSPKVPGLENRKSPGTMETLVLPTSHSRIFHCS